MDLQTNQLLERIATALELNSPSQGEPLGFIERQERKYVSIANEGEHLWHTWDKVNKRQVPIYKDVFVGFLKGLEIKELPSDEGFVYKLNLIFDCGKQTVVLQSGVDTAFSRGAVLAIAQIPASRLKERISISVKSGNKKAVLCSVTVGNDWAKSDWNDDPLDPYVAQINRSLAYVPRETGQTEDRREASDSPAGRSERTVDFREFARPGQRKYIEAPTERASGLKPMANSLPTYTQQAPVRTSVDNDITSIVAKIDIEMRDKGITPDQARKLTLDTYGKRSRTLMSLEELQHFLKFLQEEYPF